jgi:hypothetical protein
MLCLLGCRTLRHEAEPPRDAMDVCIDGKSSDTERKELDAGRGLRTNARQAQQPLSGLIGRDVPKEREVKRTAAIIDLSENRLDARGLRGSQPAWLDCALDGLHWGPNYGPPARKRVQ